MSDVIRDVQIRVNIVTGTVDLKLPDSFTSVEASAKSATKQIESLKEALEDVDGRMTEVGSKDPFGHLNQTPSGMSETPRIGRLGYGQSVRDRANEAASSAVAETRRIMQESGHNLGDNDAMKLHQKLAKQAEPMIREQDREQANTQSDQDKASQERIAAEQKEQAERTRALEEGARERQQILDNDIANQVRATKEANKKELDEKKNAAQEAVQAAAHVEQSVTMLLGVLATVAAATTAVQRASDNLTGTMLLNDVGQSKYRSQEGSANSAAVFEKRMFESRNLHDRKGFSRYHDEIRENEHVERQSRAVEAQTNLTPEEKAFERNRMESESRRGLRKKEIDEDLAHVGNKKKLAAEAKSAAEKSSVEVAENEKKVRSVAQSGVDELNQGGLTRGEGSEADKLNQQILESNAREQETILSNNKQIEESLQEQIKLGTVENKLLEEKHRLSKETKQEAYAAYHEEKESHRESQTSFGMMDPKQAAMLNIARRKAKGGQKLLPHEMRMLKSSGMELEEVDKQAAAANKKGYGFEEDAHTAEKLAAKKKRFEDAEAEGGMRSERDIEGQMTKLETEQGGLAQQLATAISTAQKALVQEVIRLMKEGADENEFRDKARGMMSTAFLPAR